MAKTKKHTATPNSPAKPATVPVTVPTFDTAIAAQTAAAIVAHKHAAPVSNASAATISTSTESSGFKNLKESLSKPHMTALGNMLDKSTPIGQKKSSQAFGFGKQVGHNQTFGADVNRRSVPRRTAG